MQPRQGPRIDLGELKAQILKKIGAERSKRYFYYLSRFLNQKLGKTEFDKSCYRLLGRENLPLHNQLIHSILKNACQAKTPPPIDEVKSVISNQDVRSSPCREDGFEQSGSLVPNQNSNATSIWSNGIFPVSPRKSRSGVRDRRLRDRPSPLGPNGKVDSLLHQSVATENNCDNGGKGIMENGISVPCDCRRPVQHLQVVAEHTEIRMEGSAVRPTQNPRITKEGPMKTGVIEDGEEVEQVNQLDLTRSLLIAPLGIPFCPASVGGARKVASVSNGVDFVTCYDTGGLPDSETLRKRMVQIAAAEGLGGVSMECANIMNNMLDVFLKKLIKSCVELVGSRSAHGPGKYPVHKQHIQKNKVVNGTWPSNNLHMQDNSVPVDFMQDPRQPQCSIRMLDFKVAMELNPQQLGEDWPLLLEKICMRSFEE